AELHSAVSQICNLRASGKSQCVREFRNAARCNSVNPRAPREIGRPTQFRRSAECNSAIQQIENLRYERAAALGQERFDFGVRAYFGFRPSELISPRLS